MKYRILEAKDLNAYKKIRLEGLTLNPEAFASSYDDESSQPDDFFISRILKTDYNIVMGLFDQSRLVGTAGFYRENKEKLIHKGHIWGVYLSPDYRGKGYSLGLMQQLINEVKPYPQLSKLRLRVLAKNTVAIKLYQRVGFIDDGVEQDAFRLKGEPCDEQFMVMPLDHNEY